MSSAVSYLTSLDPPPPALVKKLDDTQQSTPEHQHQQYTEEATQHQQQQLLLLLQQQPQKKQVRIGDTTITILPTIVEEIPRDQLWYTKEQIGGMRRATGDFVRNISAATPCCEDEQQQQQQQETKERDGDHDDWMSTMESMYRGICQVAQERADWVVDQEHDTTETPPSSPPPTWELVQRNGTLTMPPEFVVERLGTEAGAVPFIGRDAARRRRHLRDVVMEYQRAPISDEGVRSTLIRQGSRDVSRPARWFAQQVAVLSALHGA